MSRTEARPEHLPYTAEAIAVYQPSGEIESFLIPADDIEYPPASLENLSRMETDMQEHMAGESYGGNAGSAIRDGEIMPCVAVNGYADKTTGGIKIFGNFQQVDSSVVEEGGQFSLTIGISMKNPGTRVVGVAIKDSGLSPTAVRNLLLSAALYNKKAPERAKKALDEMRLAYGSQILRATSESDS